MDPLYAKAQRQIGGKGSATASKSSSKRSKKKKAPKTQTAGQSSGTAPVPVASGRTRSQRQVDSAEASGGGVHEGINKWVLRSVGALHVIDAGLGLACIVYGAMVLDVVQVAALCLCYGLILSLGSLFGGIGYFSGSCNRRGLQASSIAGILTFVLNMAAFVAILVDWDSFIAFLKLHQEDLLLGEESIDTIQSLKYLYVVLLAILAVAEGIRFMVMKSLRKEMVNDNAPLRRSASTNSQGWFSSFFGFGKKKRSEDFVMFDDNASMESALLWSKNGAQPSSEDYLEFVPEHERSLASHTSNVALPTPPADRVDY